MNCRKYLGFSTVLVLFSFGICLANEEKTETKLPTGKERTSVEEHTNPFTGTRTKTKKYERRLHDDTGSEDVQVKQVIKTKKNGEVKTQTQIDAESETK